MSAFFVGNKQISKLANQLNYSRSHISTVNWGTLPQSGEQLAKQLYEMNVEALKQRYPESYAEMIQEYEFFPDEVFSKKDGDAQFYKSLQCYLYQCSEGDVPKSETYKAIDGLADGVAHRIAMKYADARGARWE